MKKVNFIFSVMAALLLFIPGVDAKEMKQKQSTNTRDYGTITVMETDGWEEKTGGGYYINQEYSVTKTNKAGYVYIEFLETKNVKVTSVLPESSFEIAKGPIKTSTGVVYVFKLKSGTSISAKTKLATVTADIVDANDKSCNLSFSPLGTVCSNDNGIYFDKNGKEVTEDEYKASCEGVPVEPDEPNNVNPPTGSVIPYVAVLGGLASIAGVYFFSKKSNKMYKI